MKQNHESDPKNVKNFPLRGAKWDFPNKTNLAIPVGIARPIFQNLLFREIEASAIPTGIANGNFDSRNP